MTTPLRVLCLEDLPEDAELAERELRRAGLTVEVRRVDTEASFRSALLDFDPCVILCDYSLLGWDGIAALKVVQQQAPRTPAIMFTGTLPDEKAVACLKAGAFDYVLKAHSGRLPAAVATALRTQKERDDRAKAEHALRESEGRYRALVETTPDAIVTVDSENVVQLWNGAAEDMFGIPASEMVGTPLARVIPERLQGSHEALLKRAVQSGRRIQSKGSVAAIRSDGQEFPVEVSVSSVWTDDGVSFTEVIRDLTESISAMEAIERLSRQHETLLNSAGEGILGLTADGSITFANPAALSLLGMRAVDVVGETICSFLPQCGGLPPDVLCAVLRDLRDGTTFRGDLTFARANGTTFAAAVSVTPITQGDTEGGGVLVFEDITLRQASQKALEASEASFRSLVDNAPYGIYRSHGTGRFLSVNPALVKMLGYESSDELLALDMGDSVYAVKGERDRLRSLLGDNMDTFSVETTWVKKDGTPLAVRLSGGRVSHPEEEDLVYEVFVENLADRVLLENQLRQAQKMESVGQLTGGIAHDFNNVLAVILLNTELAMASLERGAAVDPDDLKPIQSAAQRASAITRKLMGFSRRADLQMEPTNVATVVRGLTQILRTMVPEFIELQIEAANEVPLTLVDPGSIEQIVLNLVANSRDALPEGGRVTVDVREVALDAAACRHRPGLYPGLHVWLQVSDNGTGMDPETLRKVFDPFFTTKSKGAGTGLGMAMVYGLTKQQKGYVEIESSPGEGTTTRLYFPTTGPADPTGENAPRVEAAPTAGRTILIVEDEDNLREVAARTLRAAGYEVLTAEDGLVALGVFADHRDEIDVVFSDLVLPGMNGLELRDALQERYGAVSFVLTSGYTGQTPVAGRIDPRIPFIRKPWTLDALLDVIAKAQSSSGVRALDAAKGGSAHE